MNKTYNKDYNNYDYILNEPSININVHSKNKKNNINNNLNGSIDSQYENNNYNQNNECVKLRDGEIQLFQKKNHASSLNNNHINNKEKIKSRQRHKNKFFNHDYYSTNKIINHFLLNKTNNNKSNKYDSNNDKPIRLNYNKDIGKEMNDKEDNDDSYEYNKTLQYKINDMKKRIGFEGNNDEFIEYLKIIKLKSDITYMAKNIFNSDEKVNEEDIKKCFYKLEHLKNKINENENLLNIYKYLTEQLLMENNINKCDILNDS